jgi:hypothetical protein
LDRWKRKHLPRMTMTFRAWIGKMLEIGSHASMKVFELRHQHQFVSNQWEILTSFNRL